MKRKISNFIMAEICTSAVLTCMGAGQAFAQESEETTEAAQEEEKAYPLTVDGKEYGFPITLEELYEDGWTVDDGIYKDLSIAVKDYDVVTLTREAERLNVEFYNNSDKEASWEACEIVGFLAGIDYVDELKFGDVILMDPVDTLLSYCEANGLTVEEQAYSKDVTFYYVDRVEEQMYYRFSGSGGNVVMMVAFCSPSDESLVSAQ